MKLRRFTKLALAGTALAATAATLTTATYAWYVSNAEVKVTGVASQVASAQTTNNLLIANNTYTPADNSDPEHIVAESHAFGAFGDSIATIEDNNQAQLSPQSYFVQTVSEGLVSGAVTAPATPWDASTPATWKDDRGNEIAGVVLTYRVWLWATASGNASTVTVTPELTVKNTTTDVNAVKQSAYKTTAGASVNEKFAVDAVDALHMTITKREYTDAVGETPASLGAEAIITGNSNIDLSGRDSQGSTIHTATSGYATGFASSSIEAGTYYRSVTGKSAYATDATTGGSDVVTTAAATTVANITLNSNKKTLLTFYVWLEGSDKSCYDSCKGQTFSFDWKFSVPNA